MKILYGVQGTGNGHITRARAMATELKTLGVDVDFVFSGRNANDYFDMDCFENYRAYEGLSFSTQNGQVNLVKTLRKANLRQFYKDVKQLDLSSYDLVITDFEPITAWAARRQGKRCIGVGHQYAFHFDIPKYQGDKLGAWVMSKFAPVDQAVGVHWHHFEQPILPPIIQHSVSQAMVSERDVLVYLPFENSEDVLEWLEGVPNYHFRMHCKDIEPGKYGNVEVYSFSRDGFQKNLSECQSVLCNAGFELNSEALHLGRRIMVKPLQGQVEQLSNVVALQHLELASASAQLSAEVILEWLESAKVVQVHYPNVAQKIAQWIAAGGLDSLESLSQGLWQEVVFQQPRRFVSSPSWPVMLKSI